MEYYINTKHHYNRVSRKIFHPPYNYIPPKVEITNDLFLDPLNMDEKRKIIRNTSCRLNKNKNNHSL